MLCHHSEGIIQTVGTGLWSWITWLFFHRGHPVNRATAAGWHLLVAGLRELTLSANPGISSKGWARLAIAVAHSSQLRVLNLDYNPLGKYVTRVDIVIKTFPMGFIDPRDPRTKKHKMKPVNLTQKSLWLFLLLVTYMCSMVLD